MQKKVKSAIKTMPLILAGMALTSGLQAASNEDLPGGRTPTVSEQERANPSLPPAIPSVNPTLPESQSHSTASQAADQQTAQPQQEQVVAVSFSPASADISEQQKQEIKQTLALAGSSDEQEVRVVTWSDKSWPAEQGSKFSKDDKKLADKRAENIKNFIEQSHPKQKVEVYSMTNDASSLAKALDTKESELTSIFAKKGEGQPPASKEVQMIRDQGGASKAVIYLKSKS